MSFVTAGLAVAGALAMAVPIIIFLLWRQRRTPVEWAAMRFLLEAYRKHRRRLQLEQLLLLALRCLALLLLGVALARPLLDAVTGSGARGRLVYLVVDDGLVSGVTDDVGRTALAANVARAVEIVEALAPSDRVGLITAARPARAVVGQPSGDHAAVIDLLRDLRPQSTPTDLPAALDRLGESMDRLDAGHPPVVAYLLSELRRGSARLDESLSTRFTGRTDVTLHALPPATTERSNVQVVGITPARTVVLPGAMDGSGQVSVQLSRQGNDLGRDVSRVRLEGPELGALPARTVTWEPGVTEARVEFMLDPGSAVRSADTAFTVRIDDDALVADNARFAVLAVRSSIRVVLVDRRTFGFERSLEKLTPGQWITRALAPTDTTPIETVTVEPAALDDVDLRAADVAIVPRPDGLTDAGWLALRRFVDRGGLAVITPPFDLTVHRWPDRITSDLGLAWQIDREVRIDEAGLALADEPAPTPLLKMISSDLEALCLPIRSERRLPVISTQAEADTVLRFADGSPALVAASPRGEVNEPDGAPSVGRGLVVYLAVAPHLDWTNLPAKPLMVPLFHELLRQGLSLIRGGAPMTVGTAPPLLVGPAAETLVTPDGVEIELTDSGRPAEPLLQPGVYEAIDRGGQAVGRVALNVEPDAARTDPQPASLVEEWLRRSGAWSFIDPTAPTTSLGEAAGGTPISGILLVIVLLLFVTETVLARWFSHAASTSEAVAGGIRASMHERTEPMFSGGGSS